ncbi:hypothetical protein, partial [Klebsiella pneumoniae]
EAGRRFCAIVDASALSQAAQPAAVSGDLAGKSSVFAQNVTPDTRSGRYSSKVFGWPNVVARSR